MWPEKVVHQFSIVTPNATENRLLPPYNMLLYTLFPPDSGFVVAPQYLQEDSQKGIDYIVWYAVLLEGKPVFVLEAKPSAHLGRFPMRELADAQIRKHMREAAGQ